MWLRITKTVRSFVRCQRGTQMIEFAIILPVLILLFAGTTELGRLFYTYTSLAKATRSGARYASTLLNVSSSTTAINNVVLCGNAAGCGGAGQPAVIDPHLTASNILITPPPTGTATVKYVTVEITGYNYTPLVFNLSGLTGGNFNISLTPKTRMRYMVN